ncbi:hypothetical protein SB11R_09810 [Pseudomonas oryzihabitans]|nr:hypothetical protein SB11R_09810 [Pseudomonas psychrotolerans]
MIPALATLFTGPLEPLSTMLRLPEAGKDVVPLGRLLEEGLPELLQRYGGSSDLDQRALLSVWTKFYFSRLIPPVVAASLLRRWRLPVAVDQLGLVLNEAGVPEAFVLPHGGAAFDEAHLDVLQPLVLDNLRPFIERACAQIKLSPKVLWSNAGNYLEWFVSELRKAGFTPNLLPPFEHWLEQPSDAQGGRNPLFKPVIYVDLPLANGAELSSWQWRQRRVCCIRYRLPGEELCSNCPLLKDPQPMSSN